jgi:hypothetical protein
MLLVAVVAVAGIVLLEPVNPPPLAAEVADHSPESWFLPDSAVQR